MDIPGMCAHQRRSPQFPLAHRRAEVGGIEGKRDPRGRKREQRVKALCPRCDGSVEWLDTLDKMDKSGYKAP